MILLTAVAVGLSAGYFRSTLAKRPYRPVHLHFIGLTIVSVIIQWLLFSFHYSRSRIPDGIGSSLFVLSQVLLLIFALKNWKIPGFWLLSLGLLLNMTVIIANGGWMPIAPETVTWLQPNAPPGVWQIGGRLATGKDIVLMVNSTRLWIFSDQLRSPDWLPYRFAFSFGDVMIAAGAFWVFWSLGGADGHSLNKDIEQ